MRALSDGFQSAGWRILAYLAGGGYIMAPAKAIIPSVPLFTCNLTIIPAGVKLL